MEKQRYQKHVFLTSAVLAIAIFAAGFLLAWGFDYMRTTDIFDTIKQSELGAESYLVEQQFIDIVGGESCELLEPRFRELSNDLWTLGQDLTVYEMRGMFKKKDYEYLKRRYFVMEIRSYLTLLKLQEQCNIDKVGILYFYKQNDDASIRQGYVLDSLVIEYGDGLSIYSFDKYFEDTPSVDLVERHYEIVEAPALVINNEIKKEGFVSKPELKKIIESELNE